uniref:Peptidase_M50 domain-containing protein n=1 Tax=Panagrellus redivivus TaxID=6233 RepID=A0A7E4UT14_PANRE
MQCVVLSIVGLTGGRCWTVGVLGLAAAHEVGHGYRFPEKQPSPPPPSCAVEARAHTHSRLGLSIIIAAGGRAASRERQGHRAS